MLGLKLNHVSKRGPKWEIWIKPCNFSLVFMRWYISPPVEKRGVNDVWTICGNHIKVQFTDTLVPDVNRSSAGTILTIFDVLIFLSPLEVNIYVIWYDMIHDMKWHGMAWHGMAWMHGMAWHGMIYDMIWYMIWYDTTRYDTIRYMKCTSQEKYVNGSRFMFGMVWYRPGLLLNVRVTALSRGKWIARTLHMSN